MNAVLFIYLAGVAAGLWRTDGRLLERIGLAILWPVGLVAFVATVALLTAASLIAFPMFGVVAVLGAAAAWWWLG